MDLKEYQYLLAIAEEGSISHAAERLYMAQSTLSQFLSKYEAELNVRLFMRTANGVRPTYSGEIFLEYARRTLFNYHQVKNKLRDIEHLYKGRIEFGISTFRGTYLLPPVLRKFHETYPDIEVVIHEHNSLRLEEMVTAGKLDMALIALPEGTAGGKESVMEEEVCIVTTENHPVMQYAKVGHGGLNRPWVEMQDAAKYEFFLSNRYTILGNIAQRQFLGCGVHPKTVNMNMTAQFAAAMARQGLGLAFTYRSCAVPQPGVIYLSIGRRGCYLDLSLEYPADGYRSYAARALAALIKDQLASEPGNPSRNG